MIHEFYNRCFSSDGNVNDTVPDWVDKRWNSEVLEAFPEITGQLVRTALLSFKKGKACADDLVVVEMLFGLDEPFF